jgi:predicted DsbA family dithiol-disulfide isomerase
VLHASILASGKGIRAPGVDQDVLVEIWSDLVCPWCYIGKRRFETALSRFDHAGDVQVVWRSYELDPHAPADGSSVDLVEHLARKYGVSVEQATAMMDRVTDAAAGEGLEYRMGIARRGSSFDGHRLLHAAATQGRQQEMGERLFRAYFTEGVQLADRDELRRLAAEVGVDAAALDDDTAHADDVRADERAAAELGIQGVPFFAIDRRDGISGAQDPETILLALQRAWDERQAA